MVFGADRSTWALVVALVVLAAMLVVAAYALARLLRQFRAVHASVTPLGPKVAFWVAVAYLVVPFDLLPDPLLFDDIALLIGVATYINRALRPLRCASELRECRGPH